MGRVSRLFWHDWILFANTLSPIHPPANARVICFCNAEEKTCIAESVLITKEGDSMRSFDCKIEPHQHGVDRPMNYARSREFQIWFAR
jgi:hypothetical protein